MNRREFMSKATGIGVVSAIVPSVALSKKKEISTEENSVALKNKTDKIIFTMCANGGPAGFRPTEVLFNDDMLWRSWRWDPRLYGLSLPEIVFDGNALEVDVNNRHEMGIVYVEVPKGTRFLALHFCSKRKVFGL